jgi:cytochrome b561
MERSIAPRKEHYSSSQIALHWAVVALVVVQWLSHDGMEAFWDRAGNGGAPALPDDPGALTHAASGAGILVLMIARIVARLRFGAPPLPADLHPLLQRAARLNHAALYDLLVLLPVTGASAILAGVEVAAAVHGALVWLLFALLVLHVAGVIHHTFIRRDRLIWRMLVPR